MGIFDHIQQTIQTWEAQEGINPAELLELPPPVRRLMQHIMRQGELTGAAVAEFLGESHAYAHAILNELLGKGYLERESCREGTDWVYRVRFAHKRGREIPVGLWSALEQRAQSPSPPPDRENDDESADA